MAPEDTAELAARATIGVECHVASATLAPVPTDWPWRTPEERAATQAACLADLTENPITKDDTLESLDAALRLALVRRIAAGVAE